MFFLFSLSVSLYSFWVLLAGWCLVAVVHIAIYLNYGTNRTQTLKFLNIPSLIMNFKLLSGWWYCLCIYVRNALDNYYMAGHHYSYVVEVYMQIIYIFIYTCIAFQLSGEREKKTFVSTFSVENVPHAILSGLYYMRK